MRMHARIAIEGRRVRIARWMREPRRASQRSANISRERASIANSRPLTEHPMNRARDFFQIAIRARIANEVSFGVESGVEVLRKISRKDRQGRQEEPAIAISGSADP
jgi:hypothetical protein